MDLNDMEVEINLNNNIKTYREIIEHYNISSMDLEEKAEHMKQLLLDNGDKIERIEFTPTEVTLYLIETK